jgi:hypothetical protein
MKSKTIALSGINMGFENALGSMPDSPGLHTIQEFE